MFAQVRVGPDQGRRVIRPYLPYPYDVTGAERDKLRLARHGHGSWQSVFSYVKAPMPVMARPTMSVCMVSVPSKVWMASMSTMCRMTW